MIVRDSQIREIRKSTHKKFEDDMVVHLHTSFAEETEHYEEDELRELIRRGIDRAFQYDITIAADVSRFIEYMVCYDENFDTDPGMTWTQKILNNKDLSGTKKMDEIDKWDYILWSMDEE